jgi:hypothetical protein
MKTEYKKLIIEILELELKRRRLALVLFSVSGSSNDALLSASSDLQALRGALIDFKRGALCRSGNTGKREVGKSPAGIAYIRA